MRQAEADLRAAEALIQNSTATSPTCMMLQMVFEKLAKAYRLKGGESYDKVRQDGHRTMGKWIPTIQRQSAVFKNQLGQPSPQKWNQWLGELRNLEDAQPAIAQGNRPQLEYPWQHGGQVRWPEDHLGLGKRLMDPHARLGADLLRFAHTLIKSY